MTFSFSASCTGLEACKPIALSQPLCFSWESQWKDCDANGNVLCLLTRVKSSTTIWIAGAIAAFNSILAVSLTSTWLSIYEMYSYPIDFFWPVTRTETRATISLFTAAMTVPIGFFSYRHAASAMPVQLRVISLMAHGAATIVALAFLIWKYRAV